MKEHCARCGQYGHSEEVCTAESPLEEYERKRRDGYHALAWRRIARWLNAYQKKLNQTVVPDVEAMIDARIQTCMARHSHAEVSLWMILHDLWRQEENR